MRIQSHYCFPGQYFPSIKAINQTEFYCAPSTFAAPFFFFFLLSKPSLNCYWSWSSMIEWKEQLLLGSSEPIPPPLPLGRRRRARRFSPKWERGRVAASINKPLADEDAHAVNICPRAVTLGHAPLTLLPAFHPVNSLNPFAAGPRQVSRSPSPSPPPPSSVMSGMWLLWRGFANTAARREMRFLCYHYLAGGEKSHVSLWADSSACCALCFFSTPACRTITEMDR